MTSVVLLATTAGATGGPASLTEVDGVTLLGRLLGATVLADRHVEVVTRPGWIASVRETVGEDVVVRGAQDVIDLLAHLEALPPGPVAVAPGDLVVHEWALATLIGHPGSGSAALVGDPDQIEDEWVAPVRTARGRITAAASPDHTIVGGDAVALDVVRIGADDRGSLHARAGELERLLRPGQDGEPATGTDPDGHLLSVLLVALIRSSCPVTPVRLTTARWDRPGEHAAAKRAIDRLAEVDEERVRLRSAVKHDDGFFTTFFVSSYSPYVARYAARRGWTPNQVTVLSMLLGVLAAGGFAHGSRGAAIAGAVVLQVAFLLDCVDGQLARYTLDFSTLGAWLDAVFDRAKEYVVYAGLAIGGVRLGQGDVVWLLAAVALALQMFRHTLDFGYAATQERDLTVPTQPLGQRAEAGPAFWESAARVDPTAVDNGHETDAPRPRLAQRGVALLRRTDGIGPVRWTKRIVVLPIGERFALLSILAATTDPRTTFTVLLVWSGLAAAYTFTGRLVRSLA